MKIFKGIWCLKNFQKNFPFYASSPMIPFSLKAMSKKGILKENSAAEIKRNVQNLYKQLYVEEV